MENFWELLFGAWDTLHVVLELFLSINVLYYVVFHVLCGPQEQ